MQFAPLYTAQQSHQIDQLAFNAGHRDLMAQAGANAFEVLTRLYPKAKNTWILCGKGNNGGDGFVVATLALQAGLSPYVSCPFSLSELAADAQQAAQQYLTAGGTIHNHYYPPDISIDLIVDGLLGTGLKSDVRPPFSEAITHVNAHSAPVLALDIPSGLSADTGRVYGCAIRAAQTVTFITQKPGLYTADGPDHAGHLHFCDLNVAPTIYQSITPTAHLITAPPKTWLPPRPFNCHKKDFGPILIIAGEAGMPGAAMLASEAALYMGTGLVHVLTAQEHRALLTVRHPELVLIQDETFQDLMSYKAIIIGPGCNADSSWLKQHIKPLLQVKALPPLILDAGILHQHELIKALTQRAVQTIITPHPGEAASLLNTSSKHIQHNRLEACQQLAKQFNAYCVLKGCGTIISLPQTSHIFLCPFGHPAMASAGMGDVLTGVLAAFIAQGLPLNKACLYSVTLHALTGEKLATASPFGILASSLASALTCKPHNFNLDY